MNSTADTNTIINKAKQNRADYIASKVQGGIVPVALAALVSLALVHFTSAPTPDQAQHNPVVDVSAQNG